VKYKVSHTTRYAKDVNILKRRGYDLRLLNKVIDMLISGKELGEKYKDHPLKGNLKGFRDCHIKDDWVLVYQKKNDKLVLVLSRTGSHSDLGI
jgi:mRNA interferase YafQ